MKCFHLFRIFYAKQLELIISIEAILVPKTDQETMTNQQRQKRAVQILIIVNLIINLVCFPFLLTLPISYSFVEDTCYYKNNRCSSRKIPFSQL
jgi:hypothetical protein